MTAASPDGRATRDDAALVLIVDDNGKNRKLARDVLLAAGFRTLEAATGAEGITSAVRDVPDVILMDLRLPDMDGVAAVRELTRDPRTARIPVVALSASRREGVGDALIAAGFAGYLEKPFSVREFPEQVRRYCSGVRA